MAAINDGTGVTARARLTLLSRAWCHLCDDMLAELKSLAAVHEFDVDVVDVDADPGLERIYGEHVPVLFSGQQELCRHRLDMARVTAFLAAFSSAAGAIPLE